MTSPTRKTTQELLVDLLVTRASQILLQYGQPHRLHAGDPKRTKFIIYWRRRDISIVQSEDALEIRLMTPSRPGHYLSTSVYGPCTVTPDPKRVEEALKIIDRHMVLDDLANI